MEVPLENFLSGWWLRSSVHAELIHLIHLGNPTWHFRGRRLPKTLPCKCFAPSKAFLHQKLAFIRGLSSPEACIAQKLASIRSLRPSKASPKTSVDRELSSPFKQLYDVSLFECLSDDVLVNRQQNVQLIKPVYPQSLSTKFIGGVYQERFSVRLSTSSCIGLWLQFLRFFW